MIVNLRSKKPVPSEILKACNGDRIVAGILYGRGFDTPEKIKDFFLHAYVPAATKDLKDMDIAVNRISQAIDKKETICVYGDYDVDGVTSTSILMECLQQLGADCFYHVPDRFTEGYGMNCEVIKKIADKGVKLIVTCDCGISNCTEIELAQSLGMEVIVTDHHSIPQELPSALCLINPKLWGIEHPAYYVSGAVVAFYVARALFEKYGKISEHEKFYDLVALSIVADVVTLNSENRYLLKKGLESLTSTERPGLISLIQVTKSNADLDEEFIGFQLAPRINAAGRLESARKAVNLLTTNDESEVFKLAEELDSLNQARKKIESDIVEKAEEMIASGYKDSNIFALYDSLWHHGVIGIAAGRLCEKYGKPVILMTLKEDGETVVGSARSPEGVSIYEILSECSPKRLSFGGHAAAAGLSLNIKELTPFIHEVEKVALRHRVALEKVIDVDLELNISEIDEGLWNSLKTIAPFGEGFERPVFLSKQVKVVSNLPIKKIGRRLVFQNGSDFCNGVLWREISYEQAPEECEIVYNVNQTIFRNQREIRLNVLQIIEEHRTEEAQFKPEGIRVVDLRQGTVPDCRKSVFAAIKNCPMPHTVFYEGMDKELREFAKDRFSIQKASTLAIYSIPPTAEVFKSIVSRAQPEELVLSFADTALNKDDLIKKAAGLVKFIITKKDGWTSFNELIGLLGETFEVVELLLEYFQSLGFIGYDEFEDRLFIYQGTSHGSNDCEKYKKAVFVLLDESAAFRRFLKSAGFEVINSMLVQIKLQ